MSFIRKIKKGNTTYLAEVQSVRQGSKVVQKFIRYIGKEVDGNTVLSSSISNLVVDSVKVFGPLMVLDSLARSISLHKLLGEYGKEILSIVYAHCINPHSVSALVDWFSKTDLNYILSLEKVTEERLLNAIDSLEKMSWDVLQQNIFHSVKEQYNITNKGMFYDVTNTYLYGRHCPLAKRGHSKEGHANRPIIQIGLGILRESGIPVFHSVYEGNVHDARVFSDAIERFTAFGLDDVVVVYDRGITSENNVKYLKKHGLKSICGVPIRTNIKKVLKGIVSERNLLQFQNRVTLISTKLYVTSTPYIIGGLKGKLLICFNPKMKNDIRENRYDEIQHAQQCLRHKKKIKPGLKKYFTDSLKINKAVLSKTEEMDGYSCIFSTDPKIPNEQIIHTYFEKDLVEKTFHILKGVIKLRPVRHWLHTRVVGHIFICYLSYLLLSILAYKLKLADIPLTATDALKKIETYYKVYAHDANKGFEISKTVALTKEQEKIVQALIK